MEQEKSKISEIIDKIGKGIYGDKFTILSENSKNIYDKYKETYGIILKNESGVFVSGSMGVGKTAMMKVMQKLFVGTEFGFKMVSAKKLRNLSEEYTSSELSELYGGNFYGNLCIDDVGVFNGVKRFGTDISVIQDLIIERYDLFISHGYKTHITTNYLLFSKKDSNSLLNIYGERFVDRVKEMCNGIGWSGESFR